MHRFTHIIMANCKISNFCSLLFRVQGTSDGRRHSNPVKLYLRTVIAEGLFTRQQHHAADTEITEFAAAIAHRQDFNGHQFGITIFTWGISATDARPRNKTSLYNRARVVFFQPGQTWCRPQIVIPSMIRVYWDIREMILFNKKFRLASRGV